MKKIYLTEQQFNYIIKQQMINEGVLRNIYQRLFGKCQSTEDVVKRAMAYITTGLISFSIAVDVINNSRGVILTDEQVTEIVDTLAENAPIEEWTPICNDAVVTVYNAKPEQCNKDINHTASMFRLNHDSIGEHRIVAVERTFMQEYGLVYGDVIKIEGTYKGLQDGVYQIQDTMNKRFVGKHKIDVLVPDSINIGGTWPGTFAKISILKDKSNTSAYLNLMAPQKGR